MTPRGPRGIDERLGRAVVRTLDRYEPELVRLQRLVGCLNARLLFRACTRGGPISAMGHVRVVGGRGIRVGDHCFFLGGLWPTALVCHPSAVVAIGARTGFNYGAVIEARERVQIGKDCIFGSNVRVSDSDGERVGPVIIEDGVWIAHGAQIGPGVTIGRGSVVSAGSVVARSIPAGHMAIGKPARAIPLEILSGSRAHAVVAG